MRGSENDGDDESSRRQRGDPSGLWLSFNPEKQNPEGDDHGSGNEDHVERPQQGTAGRDSHDAINDSPRHEDEGLKDTRGRIGEVVWLR